MKDGTRSVKHKASLGRRILSATLAMVMCFSMMQVGAFAEVTPAQTQAEKQILGETVPQYYTWNGEKYIMEEEEKTNPEVSNNKDLEKVKISKEIKATGEENEFDIHLKVETTEAIAESTVAPDAAVVLVIDASISMDYCPTCGQVVTVQPHCKNNNCAKAASDSVHGTGSRKHQYNECAGGTLPLDAAQEAAYNFVRNYVGYQTQANGTETYTAPNAARYLSIVAYAKEDKKNRGEGAAHVVMDWIDLNDGDVDANLLDVKDKIDKVVDGFDSSVMGGRYGTNSDAGLKLGQQMLTISEENTNGDGYEIKDVGNKFLLFLTDGEPNENTTDNIDSYGYPDGYQARTGSNNKYYNNPARRANYIRSKLGAEFYSICFGAGQDVFNWMRQYSDKCVNADNSDQLNLAFDEMIIRMQMAVDAWKVTDPMGQYIKLMEVKDLPDSRKTAVSTNGNVLSWNLRNDLLSSTTTITKPNGDAVDNYQEGMDCKITYNLDYTVKLDVNAIIEDALKAGGDTDKAVQDALEQYYLTNGETKLVYYLTQTEDGKVSYLNDAGKVVTEDEALLTMHFKVPAVKGYAAKLGFTKVDTDGNPLQGAQFTLENNAKTWSDAATSGENDVAGQETGQVTFDKWIPSADSYVLTETTAPSGYRVIDPVGFTLSYGEGLPAFNAGTVEDKLLVDYTDVTITKTWRSPGGQTPDFITVTLKQNGTAMPGYTDFVINKSDCTVNSETGIWSYTFENMIALDEEGNTYTYTVEENVPEGYKVEGQDTLNLINTATGKVNVIVTKEWLLPDTMNTTTALVDVILKANGKEVKRLENVHDGETVSFMNLDQYDENGQTILYTVGEECDTAYQQVAIDKTAEAGPTTMYTIVNTVTDETDVTVSGNKIWKDGDDADGRPESITVELYADGKMIKTADVTAANNWQYSFTGLQRYNFTREGERIIDVHEIVYTVEEVSEFDGYASSVVGSDVINTRVGTVDFTATKEWAADLSGAQHGPVSVILYANGIPVAESEAFEGSYTFEDLDKYDADGVEIEYYVIEVPVDGYTASYSDVTCDNYGNCTQNITNTRDDADDTLTITVTKVWQQPGDAETLTATFELYKGEEATGKTVQITGNGVGYFENLPRYEEVVISDIPTTDETAAAETVIAEPVTALVEIDYNVREVNIPANYTNTVAEELTADSAGNFTCNFVNTITGTTNIFVEKSWVKPSNITVPEITVAVQKYDLDSGEWIALNDAIVIKSGETNGSVKNLPAYDADGRRISYRITELSVPGYSAAVNGGYNGQTGNYEYSIVNSINPSNSEITVMKQWLDGSRSAAERPSDTLQLL
ncbi:MAG: Cna B-type domain-containing protein, partial [Firmicutes bacterium]|nr:Cna B-type domain-containing protein [Bacillota bacterium]